MIELNGLALRITRRMRGTLLGMGCLIGFTTVYTSTLTAHAQVSYNVTLTDSGISPATMSASEGEPVSMTIINRGTKVHNFVLPAFFIFTSNLQPGSSTSAKFTPDKTGSFPYYSDTGGQPEPGLRGTMAVH